MSPQRQREAVIAIDLGGTHMQAAAVDSDGRILARGHRPTNASRGAIAVIDDIHEVGSEVAREAGLEPHRIRALGVSAAGAIDVPTGVVLQAPNLDWEDVPLKELLSSRFKVPVIVENDVNAAALGEFTCGSGRAARDMLAVWVGTGIGGGLIFNGSLYHGGLETAGEIGQTVMKPKSPKGRRTLEEIASRTGMIRELEERGIQSPLDTRSIAEGYLKANEPFVSIVGETAELLGVAIANWVTVLSLPVVVVGGGMTEALGDAYLKKIRASFEEAVFPDRCLDCRIVKTQLESDAGLIGAAMIATTAPT